MSINGTNKPRNVLKVQTLAQDFQLIIGLFVKTIRIKFTSNYQLNEFVLATLYFIYVLQNIRVFLVLCVEQNLSSYDWMQDGGNLANLDMKLRLLGEDSWINKICYEVDTQLIPILFCLSRSECPSHFLLNSPVGNFHLARNILGAITFKMNAFVNFM